MKKQNDIHLVIDKASPTLNQIKGMHYQKYRKLREEWAWLVKEAATKAGVQPGDEPIDECTVVIHRYCYHTAGVRPDWDGLYGGLKPVIDCLTIMKRSSPNGLGIIVDDSPDHLLRLTAMPFSCHRGDSRTEIFISNVAGIALPTGETCGCGDTHPPGTDNWVSIVNVGACLNCRMMRGE